MLADVLQRYGALDGFRHDFRAAFDTPEAARAYANLPPLTQVFSPLADAAPAPRAAWVMIRTGYGLRL